LIVNLKIEMSFLSSNSTFLKAPLEQFEVLDLLVASG